MLSEKDFISKPYLLTVEKGNFEWSAPSNIALVKYWGKKPNQIPANPSIAEDTETGGVIIPSANNMAAPMIAGI